MDTKKLQNYLLSTWTFAFLVSAQKINFTNFLLILPLFKVELAKKSNLVNLLNKAILVCGDLLRSPALSPAGQLPPCSSFTGALDQPTATGGSPKLCLR